MVNFSTMIAQRRTQINEGHVRLARDMFSKSEHSAQLDLPSFKELIRSLMRDANASAVKHGRRRMHLPTDAELTKSFRTADRDNSGLVDEDEFMALFALAVEGQVQGLAGGFKYYAPPTQIRYWGEHAFHQETDWQDLFFDLLFVGGAYKVGNYLMDSLIYHPEDVWAGIQWFLVMFMVIAQQWFMKINLSGRFAFHSFFHGVIFDAFEFTVVAFAIWNIPGATASVDTGAESSTYSSYSAYSAYSAYSTSYSAYGHRLLASSYSSGVEFSATDQLRSNVNSQTLGFSAAIAVNNVLHLIKWMEVLWMPELTSGARTISRFMVVTYTIIGAIFAYAAYAAFTATDKDEYSDRRSKYCLYVWLAGVVVYFLCFNFWCHYLNTRKDFKDFTVPLCVDYVIHRIGEWAMLMIGETVLSLLIVPAVDETLNYAMFAGGMLVASNLSFQHYAVYPTNPNDHVLKGARYNYDGVLYLFLMIYVYSAALVMIGVGCKCLLKLSKYDEVSQEANWVLSSAFVTAFVCLNIFSVLHNQTIVKGMIASCFRTCTWAQLRNFFLMSVSTLGFVVIAFASLRPGPTLLLSASMVVVQSFVLVSINSAKDSFRDEETQKVTESEFVAARYEFAKKCTFKKTSKAILMVNSATRKPSTVVPGTADSEKAEGGSMLAQAPDFKLNDRVHLAPLLSSSPKAREQKVAEDGSYEL